MNLPRMMASAPYQENRRELSAGATAGSTR
jgi:hypothetical protein